MKANWLPLSAAVALALGSVTASAVDFHGYMRSGINYAAQGGNAYCYGNGGGKGHMLGRLGDECDTYVELSFGQEIYNKANNKFDVHATIAYGTFEDRDDQNGQFDYQGNNYQGVGQSEDNNQRDDHAGAWEGGRTSLREAWAGYTMDNGIQIWAGKRFYQRKDVHIMDYYYLNNSGHGVGVENVELSPSLGSLSFAVIKHQTDVKPTSAEGSYSTNSTYRRDGNLNVYKADVRWNGIKLWADASLDVAAIYGWTNMSGTQKLDTENSTHSGHGNNGFIGLVEYTQANFFGGFNKLSFTFTTDAFDYGGTLTSGANHLGDKFTPYHEKGKGYRLIDWGVIEQEKWNLGYALMATHRTAKDYDGQAYWGAYWTHPTGNDYAVVVRPAYKWTNFTSTVMELGWNNQTNTGWNGWATPYKDRVSATKVTLAQQFTPGTGFWSRPSIRVYASYLSGDLMDSRYTGLKDKNGKDMNHQFLVGGQVEAWW